MPLNQQNPGENWQTASASSETMDYGKMDTQSLNRMLLDRINELAQAGLVDDHFLRLHSLKEDSGPSFFLELILVFLSDAGTEMKDMLKILYQQGHVDYKNLHSHYIKLKGSSSCFGAFRITDACSHLRAAIQNKSKEGCIQALLNIQGEYNCLHDQLYSVVEIEREIVSRETGNQ
ncbi:hypothetical protein ACS0TY_000725 [Phlomoides rotata]